jgi:hypothetical protein
MWINLCQKVPPLNKRVVLKRKDKYYIVKCMSEDMNLKLFDHYWKTKHTLTGFFFWITDDKDEKRLTMYKTDYWIYESDLDKMENVNVVSNK